MGKNAFRDIADELTLGASIPFESTHKEASHRYRTMFDDHPKGWSFIESSLLLGIRTEEVEVPWSEL